MSKELVRYQKLLKRLNDLRKKNKGKERVRRKKISLKRWIKFGVI